MQVSKALLVVIFIAFSSEVYASSRSEVSDFIKSFYTTLNSSSPPSSLKNYFAQSPLFFIGEQPGLSNHSDIIPVMISQLRKTMDLEAYPFSGLYIEKIYVSEDGSATSLVVFQRSKSKERNRKSACNILSIAKLQGGWRVMGWALISTPDERICTWA
ncbi:hypothetical protein MO867_22055 [Microbulbifer sp. OS29]|uniref:DUF4440 domain-containing protein n=1 Tax=Microbulbifer okhotskensis TaxID=2926617 RepID=A0A9X2EW52_9GAMM|nr:hypothetical protein [Microbulbifer okhotskensis]MCO1337011.1 hypothetical protein [Microbulbifer okhotskensis]